MHCHVTSIVTRPGRVAHENNWTAPQVTDAIAHGDVFYTLSEATGKVAEVESFTCRTCGQEWIRTGEQAVADNTLESLPPADGHPGTGAVSPRAAICGGNDGGRSEASLVLMA
jgi:hypothetical protein